ncbi:MAG: kynureninase, partial [Pseudomonadota bacterium]|nr:kynureninase [Pseudomonadota bacterium]
MTSQHPADTADVLASKKQAFQIPDGVIYLDGNSLGVLPKHVPARIAQVINEEWGNSLIRAWNTHSWIDLPARTGDRIGKLIGAPAGTVVAC